VGCGVAQIVAVLDFTAGSCGTIVICGNGVVAVAQKVAVAVQA
jgi:hypothetical protein